MNVYRENIGKIIVSFSVIFLMLLCFVSCGIAKTTDNNNDGNAETSRSDNDESTVTLNPVISDEPETVGVTEISTGFDPSIIPEWSGSEDEPYAIINDNTPYFTEDEITADSYESYSDLDSLGRVGTAMACLGQDLMPTEERGDISSVYPTGWVQNKYDCVPGGYLYNRSHMAAYELTGENANEKNLATGTRFFNVTGMLPFENMTADYIKETDNHVMYRVTPVFEGNNLLMDGVLMEAYSVEDEGEGIEYCVFCYNVQPGIGIDYATGDNWELEK